jgi:hypothetical protein
VRCVITQLNSTWEEILKEAAPERHLVQLYTTDEQALVRNVGRYLAEGLKRGEPGLVIASAAHRTAFVRELERLGADVEPALRNGRLALIDAEETLSDFMVDGQPDWQRFESAIGVAVRSVRARTNQPTLRAYGEMVGILWSEGRYSAAIRLEEFWNAILKTNAINLFCAYPIDLFGKEFRTAGAFDAILCAHSHLLPAAMSGRLESAVNQAMDEILGTKAATVKAELEAAFRESWARLPQAEAVMLCLRAHLPDRADEVLARVRYHYEAAPL